MKVAVNAVSAKIGGAVTYLQSVLPLLHEHATSSEADLTVWRTSTETGDGGWPAGIDYRWNGGASGGVEQVFGSVRRVVFDQLELPFALSRERFDALLTSATFGPVLAPCQHVVLPRNALLFDELYWSRVRSPKVRASIYAQRLLALATIERADAVLFASRSMLDMVARSRGRARSSWLVAPFGVRHDLFRPSSEPRAPGATRLLYVSTYAEHKNFGTLFRAMELLEGGAQRFRLRVTAGFDRDHYAGSPVFPEFVQDRAACARLSEVGLVEDAVWRKHGTLPDMFRSSDVFVFPSYCESFGHPLVEAMATGLPIVAADTAINREMCGDAAVYASPFDPRAFADAIEHVAADEKTAARLGAAGLARAERFRWEAHVDVLARSLLLN